MWLTGLLLTLALSGCSTVTIKPNRGPMIESPPTYEKRHHFYVFGLVGERRVNLDQVCRGREPLKMQRQSTFVDMALQTVTLSLYKPVTAKVWC